MKKILIVEDDTLTQEAYFKKLTPLGFLLKIVTNGDDGLSELKKDNYDLVILDIMLPGKKNGFDVLEEMKRDDKFKNIPVIILTNLDSEEHVARQLGANDYLVKSNVAIEEVIAKITGYFK